MVPGCAKHTINTLSLDPSEQLFHVVRGSVNGKSGPVELSEYLSSAGRLSSLGTPFINRNLDVF